jgi:serine---pyruvate transaminase
VPAGPASRRSASSSTRPTTTARPVELRLALRDRHGITIAGGHGDLVGRLFRIGHIGYVRVEDIAAGLTAIEEELQAAGADVVRGRAAPAAFEAFGSVAPA